VPEAYNIRNTEELTEDFTLEVLPELLAHGILFGLSMVLLITFYNEALFRANPRWHSVIGFGMVTVLNATWVSISLLYALDTRYSFDKYEVREL